MPMDLAIEQVAPKVRDEIRNRTLEEAALEIARRIAYPTEACAVIRGLKK